MKDRKEEILEKRIVLFPGTPDMPSDRIKHNVLLSMEQYAKECAIGFSEWLGENGYVKMWLGEKYVGWADRPLMKQNNCVPIEKLYQQYLESIPPPSK